MSEVPLYAAEEPKGDRRLSGGILGRNFFFFFFFITFEPRAEGYNNL